MSFLKPFFQFCRHLTGECAAEWQEIEESDTKRKEELNKLIHDIIPYLMGHNAEAEACDLLMEVEKLDDLIQYVDESAFSRVCLYLKRYVVVFVMSRFQITRRS